MTNKYKSALMLFSLTLGCAVFYAASPLVYAESETKWSYHMDTQLQWQEDSQFQLGDDAHKLLLNTDNSISISTVILPLNLIKDLKTKSKEQIGKEILKGKESIYGLLGNVNVSLIKIEVKLSPYGQVLALDYVLKFQNQEIFNSESYFPIGENTLLATLSWNSDSNKELVKKAQSEFKSFKIVVK